MWSAAARTLAAATGYWRQHKGVVLQRLCVWLVLGVVALAGLSIAICELMGCWWQRAIDEWLSEYVNGR